MRQFRKTCGVLVLRLVDGAETLLGLRYPSGADVSK